MPHYHLTRRIPIGNDLTTVVNNGNSWLSRHLPSMCKPDGYSNYYAIRGGWDTTAPTTTGTFFMWKSPTDPISAAWTIQDLTDGLSMGTSGLNSSGQIGTHLVQSSSSTLLAVTTDTVTDSVVTDARCAYYDLDTDTWDTTTGIFRVGTPELSDSGIGIYNIAYRNSVSNTVYIVTAGPNEAIMGTTYGRTAINYSTNNGTWTEDVALHTLGKNDTYSVFVFSGPADIDYDSAGDEYIYINCYSNDIASGNRLVTWNATSNSLSNFPTSSVNGGNATGSTSYCIDTMFLYPQTSGGDTYLYGACTSKWLTTGNGPYVSGIQGGSAPTWGTLSDFPTDGVPWIKYIDDNAWTGSEYHSLPILHPVSSTSFITVIYGSKNPDSYLLIAETRDLDVENKTQLNPYTLSTGNDEYSSLPGKVYVHGGKSIWHTDGNTIYIIYTRFEVGSESELCLLKLEFYGAPPPRPLTHKPPMKALLAR